MNYDWFAVITKDQLREFIQFNINLYQDNPNHVPDLISDEIKLLTRVGNPALNFARPTYLW